MIKFTTVDGTSAERIMAELSECESECADYIREVYDSFCELADEGGVEVALTVYRDSLLVRIYDGDSYMFTYPIPLSSAADVISACRAIAEYTRREVIPLSFTDVPREDIALLSSVFSHIDARAYEDDDDMFFVWVSTECGRIDTVPSHTEGEITLDEICDGDTELYSRLCSDRELNRWWGYDASVDNAECDPEFYMRVARREFVDGTALTLAVRHRGSFVGEAVIYDFDYCGSAAIGVRILPEYHGLGIGTAATSALISLCRKIGLKEIRTQVMEENAASVRMTERLMDRVGSSGGVVDFIKAL